MILRKRYFNSKIFFIVVDTELRSTHHFKQTTPSNVNKTINDEKITPDAKRVKLFSGPDGEKMDSINESQQPQPESLDTQSLILCSSDGQSFDSTTVIKKCYFKS